MSRWIDKRATFDPSDSIRADKVAFYFTEAGLLCGSLDGISTFTVPLAGVARILGNKTLTAADSALTQMLNAPAGVTLTLPAANKGPMLMRFVAEVDITSNQLRFIPASTDKFSGRITTTTAGKYVEVVAANINAGDVVTLQSDGVNKWIVGSSNPAAWAAEAGALEAARDAREPEDKPILRRGRGLDEKD